LSAAAMRAEPARSDTRESANGVSFTTSVSADAPLGRAPMT